jgi:hypothetical protein
MSKSAHDGPDAHESDRRPDGVETVESYETDDGVVLFDAENPLAWVESSAALRLSEQV